MFKFKGLASNDLAEKYHNRLPGVFQIQKQLESHKDIELFREFESLRVKTLEQSANDIEIEPICNFAAACGALAISRVLGFQLHDAQIAGALATADGSIIQMETGEGKTVVCGLAAIIRTLWDQSIHVATTNSYLAERDHSEMQPAFQLLGISSSKIDRDLTTQQLRAGYRCNITYAPGYIFGFDYLKDQIQLRNFERLTLGRETLEKIHGIDPDDQLTQRSRQTIIIDEADSVLIDESTTPLLLSGPAEDVKESTSLAYQFARDVASELVENTSFTIDWKKKRIELTDLAVESVHKPLAQFGCLDLRQPWQNYIKNAIYAEYFLLKDEHYVVDEEKVKLVDQNTGRIFEDRSLRSGLHQAVEAKECVPIHPPNSTLARITRQRYFQLYETVCGMTGTAQGIQDEVRHFYQCNVVSIKPNLENQRTYWPDRYFVDFESKLKAVVSSVSQRTSPDQPVLIGTRTIRQSEQVEKVLTETGYRCQILNGTQDAEEADIISRAGLPGQITIATNMAGRGTDIKLNSMAVAAGGLHVIGMERSASRRIDNQLIGRSARQGDPGSCQFFLSADDLLLTEHAPQLSVKIRSAANHNGECQTDISDEIKRLQRQLDTQAFQKRLEMVRQESWLDSVRESIAG